MATRLPHSPDLDDTDRIIIDLLKGDGRIPLSRIADQLSVSPGMIRQRVQRLTENGLLQFVAVTNPLKIGYHTMAMIGVKADGSRLREIARQIAAFDEVIYLVITSAAYDLLVEVVCYDNHHLLEFLTEKLNGVDGVRDTEAFIYLDIVKEIYSWPVPDAVPGDAAASSSASTARPIDPCLEDLATVALDDP